MSGFPGGGSDRFAGSDIIPHFARNGSALTQEERAAIAKRKGLCVLCGTKTHTISIIKRDPLTNESVHKGICIKCNPTSVPAKVLQDWKHRNPRVTASVVAQYKPPPSSSHPMTPRRPSREGKVVTQNEFVREPPTSPRERNPVTQQEIKTEQPTNPRERKAVTQKELDLAREIPCLMKVTGLGTSPQEMERPTSIQVEGSGLLDVDGVYRRDRSRKYSKKGQPIGKPVTYMFERGEQAVGLSTRRVWSLSAACSNGKKFFLLWAPANDLTALLPPTGKGIWHRMTYCVMYYCVTHDKATMLAACSRDGLAIQCASEELKNDVDVALKACANNGMALQYVSESLRADWDVAMAAYSQNAIAVRFSGCKEHVLKACTKNGMALQYVSETLQADRDVVMAAYSQNAMAVQFSGCKEVILEACTKNGMALQYVSETLRADRDVVMAACSQNGMAIQYSGSELLSDKEVALKACINTGMALQFVSERLRADKDVVLAALESNPGSFKFALGGLKQDKECLIRSKYSSLEHDPEVLMMACSEDGLALQFAANELRKEREVVAVACTQNGLALQHAAPHLKNDRTLVMAACSQNGVAIQYASEEVRSDKAVVLEVCTKNGIALQFVSQTLQADRDVALSACSQNGMAIQYSSKELLSDKEVALKACTSNGMALQCISDTLRADKDVVLAAVESNPESLKFALGGLNQNKDCLITAKLWDKDYAGRNAICMNKGNMRWANKKKKIVLSTKFSLAAESSSHATKFTVELKNHRHIKMGKYVVYSPNAYNKGTCDPQWTNINWPCRGTYKSCQKPHHLKIGVPEEAKSCWRYSFRYQLKEAYDFGGFMIQVVDFVPGKGHDLGNGQRIERELAKDIGIKIFRFFEPVEEKYSERVDELVSAIQSWYNNGCCDTADHLIGESHGDQREPDILVKPIPWA